MFFGVFWQEITQCLIFFVGVDADEGVLEGYLKTYELKPKPK
jgi:hypothetical protein